MVCGRRPAAPISFTREAALIEQINIAILIGAGLIVLSTLTSLVSQRIGAPLLLVFLAIGLFAGEDGPLGITFDSGGAAYFIGSLALAIILFDSGFETSLASYRVAARPALTLATLGVALTAGIVGLAAHLLLGLDWARSLLLGAIVASTDAAAVFFLLRVGGINLRERVKATLEIESGANDPMAIFLTTIFVELAAAGGTAEPDALRFAGLFLMQIGLGVVYGAIGGFVLAALMNRLKGVDPGLFPIAALAGALVIFAAAGLLGGSGFLAAYVAGLVANARGIAYAQRLRRFQVGMTWLAQIGMFLTLGLLATPSEFGAVFAPALALAFVLIFLARPAAVWLCLAPFGFKWREKAFVGWVGLRGAVSILLAILPGLGGVAGGDIFFNVVFIMVLASLIVQGWTIGVTARLLNMLAPVAPGVVDRVELELPGADDLELVGYRIDPESAVAKGERAPRWARPVLIMRGARALSVHNAGRLMADDRVYLFASPRQIGVLDRIYAHPGGVDEALHFGDFLIDGAAGLCALAAQYGFAAPPDAAEATVADALAREFSGAPQVGDRVSFGAIDLIVHSLDTEGRVARAGVIVDPAERRDRSLAARAARRIRFALRRLRDAMSTRQRG